MEKNKKDKKKKMKSLILLLFLTIVLLSTSTYAWFTANRSVSIDPIDVHIAASSGLQISVDASEWKTIISNDDIKNPGEYASNTARNLNQLPTELAPVSTTGDATNGYLTFYKGVVAGDTSGNMALTATATGAEQFRTTGDYIAFDVFLKVDDEEADVYLENGSGVTVTVPQTGTNPDKGLQYAARYAFVIEGHTNSDDTVANMQNLVASGSTTATIFEPNYDAHKSGGTTNAARYYGISNATTAASGVDPISYLGVKAAITNPIVLIDTNPGGDPSSTYFKAVSDLKRTNVAYSNGDASYSYYGKQSSDTNLVKAFTLTQGVTKVRVYMWVEGQDVDCENSASGAFLTYKLGFTLDDAE